MMASPIKLDSNIMELVCRTCLKINENRFNIFEHSQYNKLVSEMLMECIPLKVQKDDGFPTTICNVCLEKLISVLDFKEMAMLSFTKLHDFYKNKALKHEISVGKCDSNDVFEEKSLKAESNDLFNDLIETSVYKCIAGLEIPHNENTHGNNNQEISKEKFTAENTNSNSSFENKISVSNISNNENDSIELTQDISNSNDLEQPESIKCEEQMQVNLKHKRYRRSGNSNMKRKVSSRYESVSNSVDDSAYSNHYSSDSENDDGNSSAKQLIKDDERKDKNAFNWIEKHIDILNNPDCKKIISMGLSKKEKDRATVVCKECGKTVNFRYYVQVHAQTHIGNMPFKCERCAKSFPQRHILNQHIRAVHEKTIKLSCDVCGKGFASPSILLQHKAKHSDVKPFKCETCGKTFKLSGTLKKHYVVHKKDKQYMCELCGKSFLESNNLREHILSHTTDKNFNCTICEKSFTTKRGLDCHIKRHSGVRPYVCSYCGKTFTVGSVLKKHILIHTGAKPYTCKVCDRKFTQDSSLRYHMRIHTGEKPYSCELCCVDFRYKHLLKNHMNKQHKSDVKQESNS